MTPEPSATPDNAVPSQSVPPEPIQLAQFLKLKGIASTGGVAKVLIQTGEIEVNGEIETRRGRKLVPGDRIQFGDQSWVVE